jgi:hypothetical protein
MVKRRCKVGDLAIIIKASYPGHKRNIGNIVEVISESSISDWLIEARGTPLCGTGLRETNILQWHIPDEWLQPLPGIKACASQTTDTSSRFGKKRKMVKQPG